MKVAVVLAIDRQRRLYHLPKIPGHLMRDGALGYVQFEEIRFKIDNIIDRSCYQRDSFIAVHSAGPSSDVRWRMRMVGLLVHWTRQVSMSRFAVTVQSLEGRRSSYPEALDRTRMEA